MTLTDYLIDSLLVLLVLRQVRESRLDAKATILPLVIVASVAHTYLRTVPTGANDLALICTLTAVGVGCGLLSAMTTRVRVDARGLVLAKAGWVAAGVWVLSMSSRFAFAVWASHGGGPSLMRFTMRHHLNVSVWTAALVLMALGEVVSRTLVLHQRARLARADVRDCGIAAPAPCES